MKINEKAKNIFFALVLVVLIIPAVSGLLRPGFFPMHDDMQAMRLLQMDKCIKDGQIPCRWVPDMGYGYGYPQFNYYAPLPYYGMEIFHIVGFGFLDSVKIFFVMSVIIAALGMYFLGKDLWGPAGGLISAVFYTFAPYKAVDLYVRGAVGEIAGMMVFPYIFLFINRLVIRQKKSVLYLALSFATLFTSHNISIVFFIPVSVIFFLVLNYFNHRLSPTVFWKNCINFLKSFIWGFMISSFFVLPAFFEQKFVKVETLTYGYFNYISHFVGLKQLFFDTFWGYGSSVAGSNDQIFLGIGILHWVLALVSLIIFIYLRKKQTVYFILFFILIGFAGAFMVHPKSRFIWESIPLLAYFQFPWRFLILTVFVFSIAGGSLGLILPRNRMHLAKILLPLYFIMLIFYASYFKPSKWLSVSDSEKFSGESWQLQQTVSINDYLPVYAATAPQKAASPQPEVLEGEAEFASGQKGSDWERERIKVSSNEAKVRLQILYFPGWKVWIDGVEKNISYDEKLGLITVNIPQGDHELYAKLTNTPVRNFGNLLSLGGLLLIPIYLLKPKKK